MGMLKTYDPKKILMSCGPHPVTGYSDGTFVNIAPVGDGVTSKTGCDGEKVRSLDPDNSYTVTLTLLQNSPTIAWAQKQYMLDKETGDGMFPILIKDMKGGMIFSAEHAWIVNSPEREFGREVSDREIVIETGAATLQGEAS
jgi:hypothetical protein